jgi:precorrin-4 methylase
VHKFQVLTHVVAALADASMLKALSQAHEATLSEYMSQIERLKQENASLQLSIVTLEGVRACWHALASMQQEYTGALWCNTLIVSRKQQSSPK